MTLTTAWAQAMGLGAPIVNAPMGGVAGGRLAAAVSAAGGLGMVGSGSTGSPGVLDRETALLQGAGLPFGVGLVAWTLDHRPALLDVAVAARPALIAVSFGDRWPWARTVRDAGILTATQVATTDAARRAVDAGIDVLVARGAEGGGHGATAVGLLPLLEGVLDAVSVPVLAAGGITSGRGLAAVLAAGASGAWLGTAFATCPESLADEGTRRAMVAAGETDTVATDVFDVALGHPWPPGCPERVVRNDFSDHWDGRAGDLDADAAARAALAAAVAAADHRLAPVDAGQGVGLVTEVRTAGDVLARLCTDAEALLARWATPDRT